MKTVCNPGYGGQIKIVFHLHCLRLNEIADVASEMMKGKINEHKLKILRMSVLIKSPHSLMCFPSQATWKHLSPAVSSDLSHPYYCTPAHLTMEFGGWNYLTLI